MQVPIQRKTLELSFEDAKTFNSECGTIVWSGLRNIEVFVADIGQVCRTCHRYLSCPKHFRNDGLRAYQILAVVKP